MVLLLQEISARILPSTWEQKGFAEMHSARTILGPSKVDLAGVI